MLNGHGRWDVKLGCQHKCHKGLVVLRICANQPHYNFFVKVRVSTFMFSIAAASHLRVWTAPEKLLLIRRGPIWIHCWIDNQSSIIHCDCNGGGDIQPCPPSPVSTTVSHPRGQTQTHFEFKAQPPRAHLNEKSKLQKTVRIALNGMMVWWWRIKISKWFSLHRSGSILPCVLDWCPTHRRLLSIDLITLISSCMLQLQQ